MSAAEGEGKDPRASYASAQRPPWQQYTTAFDERDGDDRPSTVAVSTTLGGAPATASPIAATPQPPASPTTSAAPTDITSSTRTSRASDRASASAPSASIASSNGSSGSNASAISSILLIPAPLVVAPSAVRYSPATTTTSIPYPVTSAVSRPSSTPYLTSKPEATGSSNGSNPSSYDDTQGADPSLAHRLSAAKLIAAVTIPLALITIVAAFAFLYIRRRRRQRLQTIITSEKEDKVQSDDDLSSAHYDVAPEKAAPTLSLPPPQPVILSSISPAMSSAYYTGIDTSDAVSVPEARHSTSGSGFYSESGEEPPPPYRPRSVAPPVSRGSSLRQAQPATLSQAHLVEHGACLGQDGQNPFADPRDGDAQSNVSGPVNGWHGQHNHEMMSDVSDISYQEDEPTTAHHTI